MHTAQRQHKLLFDRATLVGALLAIAIAVAIVLAWQRVKTKREAWLSVKGTPVETRVLPVPPTQRFLLLMYLGQCRVRYVVGGKEYFLWAGAGIIDRDYAFVESRMRTCPASDYVVKFNPGQPTNATAHVRNWR